MSQLIKQLVRSVGEPLHAQTRAEKSCSDASSLRYLASCSKGCQEERTKPRTRRPLAGIFLSSLLLDWSAALEGAEGTYARAWRYISWRERARTPAARAWPGGLRWTARSGRRSPPAPRSEGTEQ
eukprot:4408987-Pleurochrysis_carterae.AAC.2